MPSTKKRINLTVPDEIYMRIQEYKIKNGLANDATACLQLIVQQLNSQESARMLMEFVQNSSLQQLMQVSGEGMETLKQLADVRAKK